MKLREVCAFAASLVLSAGLAQGQNQRQQQAAPWRSSGPSRSFERLEVSGFIGGASVSGILGPSENIYMSVTSAPQDVDLGKLFGLRASWAFTEYFAIEGNLTRGKNPYTFDAFDFVLGPFDLGEQFDAWHTVASGNLVVQIPTSIGLVPYATGGAGYVRTTPVQGPIGSEDSTSGIEFNFGGGVKYFFSTPRWLGVRFDVRYRKSEGLAFAGGSSSGITEFTIGAAARFF